MTQKEYFAPLAFRTMIPLQLRPYQKECLERAKQHNTIISLETGGGKTLIAAKLMEHYLCTQPQKRVAFMVPTRALVNQQTEYCKSHCHLSSGSPVIQTLVGYDQTSWTSSEWNESLRKSHIFVGTPAVFLDAFVKTRFLRIDDFCLLVFDECHNAIGNSPMASIMRDAVAPYKHQTGGGSGDSPRILGLTASFINGKMKDEVQKRRQLETLLLSNIYCPDVPPSTSEKQFRAVEWRRHALHDVVKEVVETHVETAAKKIKIKDASKVIKRCVHVLEELGSDALKHYIERVVVAQIRAKAKLLEKQEECVTQVLAAAMMSSLPSIEIAVEDLAHDLAHDKIFQKAPPTTPKVDELIRILRSEFTTTDHGHNGIVFVEQVALVSPLAKLLNDAMLSLNIKCGAVAGTTFQSEYDREEQLVHFRQGKHRLLAATATLEEGIDVSTCGFVVRYSCVRTTKAHIQGAGRARRKNAVIYYFENNPTYEREKAATLQATARNMSLNLTSLELQTAVARISTTTHKRHPYPFNSPDHAGQVNVYNCKQIFMNYCSKMLGQSISLEEVLYQYENVDNFQGSLRRRLCTIRYPSRTGWFYLTYNQHFVKFWGRMPQYQDVFVNDRIKNKSESEREEMCFVYFAVVLLRTFGLLDDHNKPNPNNRSDIQRNCLVKQEWPKTIRITNSVFQSYN
jgi:ERCC4-related helicase